MMKQLVSNENDIMSNLCFKGLMKQINSCIGCHKSNHIIEPFSIVKLTCENDVSKLLKDFFKAKIGVGKVCTFCGTNEWNETKTVAELPAILVLMIQRNEWNEELKEK